MIKEQDLPKATSEELAISQKLEAIIRQEIVKKDHFLPFFDYMQLALYHPQYGYYRNEREKIGQHGDFITAPTLTPIFGYTLANSLAPVLMQTAGVVYEFGAGNGDLALSILQRLPENIVREYVIVEVSPYLTQRQKQTVAKGGECCSKRLRHITQLPEDINGIVLANELLDAMPCDVVRWQDGQIFQAGVQINEQNTLDWAYRLPEQTSDWLTQAQAINPSTTPYQSELHLQQQAWLHTIAQNMTQGAIIIIDYGFGEQEYYHPQRSAGTLIGHYRHHTIHNPFFHIGLTDLTCHVNFSALAQASTDAQLDLIGYTNQANFLINSGITAELAQLGDSSDMTYIQGASACQKLITLQEMGELFKVFAVGRHVSLDWLGFSRGDLCHTL